MAGLPRKVDNLPGFQPEASSPSMVRIEMSQPDCGFCSEIARYLRLGWNEAGTHGVPVSVRRWLSPVPSDPMA